MKILQSVSGSLPAVALSFDPAAALSLAATAAAFASFVDAPVGALKELTAPLRSAFGWPKFLLIIYSASRYC